MLRFQTTIRSPLPTPTARGALLAWMQSIGYRIVSPPFLTSVDLERGSWGGNLASLNPTKWKCRVIVTWRPIESGSEATISWDITTAGQTCTQVDIEFWRYEILKTLYVCRGEVESVDAYKKLAGKTQAGDTSRALVLTVFLIGPFVAGWFLGLPLSVQIAGCLIFGGGCYAVIRAPRNLGAIAADPLPVNATTAAPPVRP